MHIDFAKAGKEKDNIAVLRVQFSGNQPLSIASFKCIKCVEAITNNEQFGKSRWRYMITEMIYSVRQK